MLVHWIFSHLATQDFPRTLIRQFISCLHHRDTYRCKGRRVLQTDMRNSCPISLNLGHTALVWAKLQIQDCHSQWIGFWGGTEWVGHHLHQPCLPRWRINHPTLSCIHPDCQDNARLLHLNDAAHYFGWWNRQNFAGHARNSLAKGCIIPFPHIITRVFHRTVQELQ